MMGFSLHRSMRPILLLCSVVLVGCASQQATQKKFFCPDSPIAFERALLVKVNQMRKRIGRVDLGRDALLTSLALDRAQTLAQKGQLDHSIHGGPAAAIRSLGLRRAVVGENQARIQTEESVEQAVLDYWTTRKTEKQNLRGGRYLRAGVGLSRGADACYCVLLLTD